MTLTRSSRRTLAPHSSGTPDRRRPWGRAALTFLLGLVAFPIGIGLALPQLAKEGATGATVAGLASLVAGAGLLLVGGVGLVRARRGWRRWLVTIPGALVAVLATTAVLGQAVALTRVPATAVGPSTPASLALGYLDVRFATPDGLTLSGWYIPSRNRAAVALLHGAGSTRSAVLPHAEVLARNGFGVLLFDARGHGRSEGVAMDAGWFGDDDVSGAVTFLAARPDVEASRIGAVGLSMGGEEAVGAAATDPRLRAVVAEGATNRTAEDLAWLSDVYGWRGSITEALHGLVYGSAALLTSAAQPISLREAVARAPETPVLLIAAGAAPDEAHAARYIATGSPSSVQLWVAPGAGHVGALATHPAEWEQRVIAFLTANLGTE